jgi:gas vesicle protein
MNEKIDSNAGYFLAGLAVGSLISIFFAPKSGEGTRKYLSKKLNQGKTQARKTARELSERADDLFERGKEMVNETKEEIAAQLDEAGKPHTPEKSKTKGV